MVTFENLPKVSQQHVASPTLHSAHFWSIKGRDVNGHVWKSTKNFKQICVFPALLTYCQSSIDVGQSLITERRPPISVGHSLLPNAAHPLTYIIHLLASEKQIKKCTF